MSDEVTFGDPTHPRHRRTSRWATTALVIAGVGVTIAAVVHDQAAGSHGAPAAHPSLTAAVATAGPPTDAACPDDVPRSAVPVGNHRVKQLRLPTGAGPRGFEVAMATDTRLLRVDLASGVVTRLTNCSDEFVVPIPYGNSPRAPRVAVTGRGPRIFTGGVMSTLGGGPVYVDYSHPTDVQNLTPGNGELLATVVRAPDGPDTTVVRRYGPALEPMPIWTLPGSVYLLGEVRDGVVLVRQSHVDGDSGELQVVDPATGALRRDFGHLAHLVDLDGSSIAWLSKGSCPTSCTLRVADLDGSGVRQYALHGVRDTWDIQGRISPDHTAVALSYGNYIATTHRWLAEPAHVDVLDLADGTTARVRAATNRDGGEIPVAWSPDGSALALTFSTDRFGRVVVWDRDTGRARVMPWVVPYGIANCYLVTLDDSLAAWR